METTKYVSRHTGEEIDSLLDKVKLDLVDSDLKKQVEDNTTAEQARDSAETARKAQFDIWTDDIAGMATKAELATETSERKTADNALKYRVKNLESANEGKTLTINTDSTAAYVKNNPDNCLDYGIVSKIYGRDRVCTNLCNADLSTFTYNGINSGWDRATQPWWNYTLGSNVLIPVKPNTSYILSSGGSTNGKFSIQQYTAGLIATGTYIYQGAKFTTASDARYVCIAVWFNDGTTITMTNANIMLNEGSTALPYEPYFDGFYNNTPSKVIVRGTNLLNTFDRSNIRSDSSLYSATLNPDGSYTSTATSDPSVWSYSNSEFKFDLEPGTYTFSAIITSSDASAGTRISDSNNNVLSPTFTLTRRTRVGIMVKAYTGSTYIMLNRGSVALKYAPYTESTIDISSLGKTLHGIDLSNSTKCDELDLVNKTYTKRYAIVDLGTLDWKTTETSDGKYRMISSNISEYTLNPSSHDEKASILCDKYETNSARNTYLDVDSISLDIIGNIYVYDSLYNTSTSASAFKTAMSGVYLVYALATPITEPLSITDDFKFFPSTSLGSLTFENTKQDDILSEVATEVKVA